MLHTFLHLMRKNFKRRASFCVVFFGGFFFFLLIRVVFLHFGDAERLSQSNLGEGGEIRFEEKSHLRKRNIFLLV